LNNIAPLSGAAWTGMVQNGSQQGWRTSLVHPLRPGPTQPGTPQPCGRALCLQAMACLKTKRPNPTSGTTLFEFTI